MRHRRGTTQHPHRVGFDFVLEKLANRLADALAAFQNDVAHEAVADDDVEAVVLGAAERNVTPFDIADEVEPRLAKEAVRLLRDGVSLFRHDDLGSME